MFWFAGCTCSPCCNMEAFMWCLGSYSQAFLKITFWGSPFIYPIYGLGGLPEGLDLDLSDAACHRCIGLEKNVNLGFSRLAAIHRGTYMLLGSSWAIVSFVHRDQGQNMLIYHKILFTFVFYLCFFCSSKTCLPWCGTVRLNKSVDGFVYDDQGKVMDSFSVVTGCCRRRWCLALCSFPLL